MVDKASNDRGALDTKVEIDDIENEDFDDAFNQATTGEGSADLSAADDPSNKKDDEPIVQAEPVATEKDEPIETPPVEPTEPIKPDLKSDISLQQPGESDEKYEQRYKTLQGIHRHDRETWKIREEELLGQIEAAKKVPTPAPAPDTKVPTINEVASTRESFIASLTPEQQEQLKNYEEEFDVVSKMEGIKREGAMKALRKELQDTISQFKTELTSQMDTKLAPALNLETEIDQDRHFSAIRKVHEDMETYQEGTGYDAVLNWIESKPSYIRIPAKEAFLKGSAEQVIEVLSDYKKENNIPLTPSDQLPEDNPNVIDLKNKRQERKQNLTAVTGRRGAVNISHAVADDFDGAFDEALNK